MTRVVLATHNAGKLRELQALLTDTGIELLPQTDLKVFEADETGSSFLINALLKARNAARQTGLPAIADDSGLEVDALDGEPGVHSARYAGPGATDADNLEKLLGRLQGTPPQERGARFRCVVVYLRHEHDAKPLMCEGVWEGRILDAPRGTNGFGYDPVFLIPEKNCSSAELPPLEKNRLSHRGQALRKLVALLNTIDR